MWWERLHQKARMFLPVETSSALLVVENLGYLPCHQCQGISRHTAALAAEHSVHVAVAWWEDGSGLSLLETPVYRTLYKQKQEKLAVLRLRHVVKSAFLCLLSLNVLGKSLLKPTWITSSTSPSKSGTQPFLLASWKCVVGRSWNSSSPQSSGPW